MRESTDTGVGKRELVANRTCHTGSMKGRRIAAMLCVLIGHAFVVLALMNATRPDIRPDPEPAEVVASLLFFIREEDPRDEPVEPAPASPSAPIAPQLPADASASTQDLPAASESEGIVPRGFVDWPVEARESAARVLEKEREAERVARMFAGPDGTWASLTKRQRSEISKFQWAPGVDGLERDENGVHIYRMKNGCVLVAFVFIGCPLGKAQANGDMFDNMREYFDEQRLPRTNEGNGTEPESKRPPRWSKPLDERRPMND